MSDPTFSQTMPRRNLPALNERNIDFWQGGARGALVIHRCRACGFYVHPAAPICPVCRSRDVGASVVSGRAVVAGFTINRQAWERGLDQPYIIAVVELVEQAGLRLTTNIVNCAPEDVSIGMAVKATFLEVEDVWIPLFEPVAA